MSVERPRDVPPDAEVRRLLRAQGWKQGAMFHAPGAELWWMDAEGAPVGGVVARGGPVPGDGEFVVVSQDCDILAPTDKEPFVEALVCMPEPDSSRRRTFRGSFRWYEIDPATGLVAHVMYRVAFAKRWSEPH